jgi:hypothetical protein
MLEGRELASTVERLAGRFAAACGGRVHGSDVRELAHELLVGVVGALRVASIGEIADALATLERRPKTRASTSGRTPSEGASDRHLPVHPRKPATAARRGSPELPPASAAPSRRSRDPFDITKPGELLDPTAIEPRREEEHPPSSERRASRPPRAERHPGQGAPRPRGQPVVAASEPSEAAPVDPPPPAVTLREGEHLLRAGGSGVVIRRVRMA